jgi:exonuclease VII large subunit
MSDTDKAARVWFVEKSESGTFDLTDWPSYCDEDESEIFNSLPDEVELVEKSYADALEKELSIHLQNALAAKDQLEELSQAQTKIGKLEGELRLSKNITVQGPSLDGQDSVQVVELAEYEKLKAEIDRLQQYNGEAILAKELEAQKAEVERLKAELNTMSKRFSFAQCYALSGETFTKEDIEAIK